MATTRKTSVKKKTDVPDTPKKYVAIRSFYDLEDDRHLYVPGDEYPRAGLEVTEERIAILSSDRNKPGYQLIKER